METKKLVEYKNIITIKNSGNVNGTDQLIFADSFFDIVFIRIYDVKALMK